MLSLIVMTAGFEKFAGVHDGVPVEVAVAVDVAVAVFVGVKVFVADGVGVSVFVAVAVFVGVAAIMLKVPFDGTATGVPSLNTNAGWNAGPGSV